MMNATGKIQWFALAAAILMLPLSITACHAALIVFILAWVAEGNMAEKMQIVKKSPLLIVMMIFLALHLISVFVSADTGNAWFNVEKKLWLFFVPVAILTSRALTRAGSEKVLKLFIASALVATVLSLSMALLNYAQPGTLRNFDPATEQLFHQYNPGASGAWMNFSYIMLAGGIGLHPTYFSMYLSFTLLLLLHFYLPEFPSYRPGKKILLTLVFIYFVVFILLLSSRIVILATLGVSICYGWMIRSNWTQQSFARIALLIALPLLLLLPVNPVTRYRSMQEPLIEETYFAQSGVYTYSTGIRKSLWFLSEKAMLSVNPMTGTGTGDVTQVIEKLGKTYAMNNIIGNYDPHNQFVYTYLGIGLPGLLTLLCFLAWPTVRAIQTQTPLYFFFIILLCCVAMTESILESHQGIDFVAMINPILIFHFNLDRIPTAIPVQT